MIDIPQIYSVQQCPSQRNYWRKGILQLGTKRQRQSVTDNGDTEFQRHGDKDTARETWPHLHVRQHSTAVRQAESDRKAHFGRAAELVIEPEWNIIKVADGS